MEAAKQTAAEPLIEVRGVSKNFGAVNALINCNIKLMPGEIHALVGGNGAGKSTLVSILSGNTRPSGGDIFYYGEKITIRSPQAARKLGIATVYQNLALANNLNVPANVFMGREILKKPPLGWLGFLDFDEMHRQTVAEIKRLKVTIPNVNDNVVRMSGGQRQCVACARALMGGAPILMMDEPTAALGVKETAQVIELMKNCASEGAAVLLISHNMEEVFAVSDRITVLRLGCSLVTVKRGDIEPQQLVGLITGAVTPKELELDTGEHELRRAE